MQLKQRVSVFDFFKQHKMYVSVNQNNYHIAWSWNWAIKNMPHPPSFKFSCLRLSALLVFKYDRTLCLLTGSPLPLIFQDMDLIHLLVTIVQISKPCLKLYMFKMSTSISVILWGPLICKTWTHKPGKEHLQYKTKEGEKKISEQKQNSSQTTSDSPEADMCSFKRPTEKKKNLMWAVGYRPSHQWSFPALPSGTPLTLPSQHVWALDASAHLPGCSTFVLVIVVDDKSKKTKVRKTKADTDLSPPRAPVEASPLSQTHSPSAKIFLTQLSSVPLGPIVSFKPTGLTFFLLLRFSIAWICTFLLTLGDFLGRHAARALTMTFCLFLIILSQ